MTFGAAMVFHSPDIFIAGHYGPAAIGGESSEFELEQGIEIPDISYPLFIYARFQKIYGNEREHSTNENGGSEEPPLALVPPLFVRWLILRFR
jgi:hypothetical protein